MTRPLKAAADPAGSSSLAVLQPVPWLGTRGPCQRTPRRPPCNQGPPATRRLGRRASFVVRPPSVGPRSEGQPRGPTRLPGLQASFAPAGHPRRRPPRHRRELQRGKRLRYQLTPIENSTRRTRPPPP